MWYPATVPPPAAGSDAVTRAQAATQLGRTLDNGLADRLIATARGYIERYCGITITAQDAAIARCDDFCDMRRLPLAPVREVVSIVYVDQDGADQTLASSVYELRADGLVAAIVLKYGQAWPAIRPGSRITLTAKVGWEAVPEDLQSAILLQLSKLNSVSRSDPALRQRSVDGVGARSWDTSGQALEGLDRAVADLLENFRCFPS